MGKLFKTICEMDTLFRAWQQVKKKGAAGGIDGQDIASFDLKAEYYLSDLKKELENGRYISEPYLSIKIPKSTGSKEKRQYRKIRHRQLFL